MSAGYFIGPQDLRLTLPVVPEEPGSGPILMVESIEKGTSLPYHKHKLVLILAAYRHYRDELIGRGHRVHYITAKNYVEGLRSFQKEYELDTIHVMEPRDWGMTQSLKAAQHELGLEFHDDGGPTGLFFLQRTEFANWAKGRKLFRQDQFYRWMRKRLDILLEPDGKPTGGNWSFDKDNRKHARGVHPPEHPEFPPSTITLEVMAEVDEWARGPGQVDTFNWPVTRTEALRALRVFMETRLSHYGDYQDALIQGNSKLWHALISPVMNIGLLSPHEAVEMAIDMYEEGRAPLNSVEGFIRQVMGWREYIRGMYWERMPELRTSNRYDAKRALPDFFWGQGRTDLACLDDAIQSVLENGYAHHIQRLMVLGNYCLLAGIEPEDVSHWFWGAFVDSSEWVELPNVVGMALGADPTFTTKPYAASGAYINRMSDHCKGCNFNVKARHGEDACPYNYLFWNFMIQHRDKLDQNPRLGMLYKSYDRWDPDERASIQSASDDYLSKLVPYHSLGPFAPDKG